VLLLHAASVPEERGVSMDAALRRAVPCGGAVEVARSYLTVHVRDGRTGACRGCRDHYPCPERRDAEALLGVPRKRRRGVARVVLDVFCLVAAVLLVLLP